MKQMHLVCKFIIIPGKGILCACPMIPVSTEVLFLQPPALGNPIILIYENRILNLPHKGIHITDQEKHIKTKLIFFVQSKFNISHIQFKKITIML